MTDRGGFFISFEGLDGAGKSTQIRRLVDRLRQLGRQVVESVEPGGTRVAQRIREVLLDPATSELSPTTELLLYFAARAQNVDQVIRPALERGAIVVSDRFTDSTLAYQGFARGLGEDLVRTLHGIACRDVDPNLTVFLDIDVLTSALRIRNPDRIERESNEFRRRVREAYLKLATEEPARFFRVDGSLPVEEVAGKIWNLVVPHV